MACQGGFGGEEMLFCWLGGFPSLTSSLAGGSWRIRESESAGKACWSKLG